MTPEQRMDRLQLWLWIVAVSVPLFVIDWNRFHTYLVVAMLATTIAVTVGQRLPRLALPGFALAYFVLSASMVTFAPRSPYERLGDTVMLAADATSSQALVVLLLTVLPFLVGGVSLVRRLTQLFSVLCLLDSALVIIGKVGWDGGQGILGRNSIDAAFIAVTYPLLAYRMTSLGWRRAVAVLLPPAAIFVVQGNAGVTGLIAGWLAWHLVERRSFKVSTRMAVGTAIACAGLAWLLFGSHFMDERGRFFAWSFAWRHRHLANPFVGFGLGMWGYLGPMWQGKELGATDVLFTWMHNDWLQVLFETGIIGLALASAVFLDALRRLRWTPWAFASLVTFGVVALTQMPLRLPIVGLYGALLLAIAYDKEITDAHGPGWLGNWIPRWGSPREALVGKDARRGRA